MTSAGGPLPDLEAIVEREREKAEVRNESDNLIYATEKSLKDYGDKVSADEKSKIEEAITACEQTPSARDTLNSTV